MIQQKHFTGDLVAKIFPDHPNGKPNLMEANFAKSFGGNKVMLEKSEHSFYLGSVLCSLKWLAKRR